MHLTTRFHRTWRLAAAGSIATAILVAGLATVRAAGPDRAPADGAVGASPIDPLALLAEAASAAPLAKIEPRLLTAATAPGEHRQAIVIVTSDRRLDLSAFGPASQFTWPAGEHLSILQVPERDLLRLAALPGVARVESGDPSIRRDYPTGLDHSLRLPSAAELAAQAEAMRAAEPWSAPPTEPFDTRLLSGDVTPDGWWDVRDGHAGQEAWELGYRGEGVRVAVLDDVIDFAHPDLHGTWAVLPEGHPYEGWPQAFEVYATYLHSLELNPDVEVNYSRNAGSGIVATYQASAIEEREVGGEMKPTACLQPLIYTPAAPPVPASSALGPEACDFVVPESLSGEVRFGHHPDPYLRGLAATRLEGGLQEWAGVLLVDANEAGVYDTVYVDLDNDRDFTDDKPTTKGDPVAWRDVTGDDIADVTGGMLNWISDGENPLPGAYLWGYEDNIPDAGTLVSFMYAYGSHGTLCASNVASQGVLGLPANARLEFRDLGGSPESMNVGMAPDAGLVSIGDVYFGPIAVFRAAWRYSVFGHDMERTDDDIQVTSNSYGFSGTDNDGWDVDSRLIDYYIRTFSPSTSFLASTGNGAPGYGTLAPPSPGVGMGIAASTQMGSTGYDSITDTSQITYGDIIPFSNRGPGADGRNGPNVAADGAYGGGAVPINGSGDGTTANGTWGGTSRSSPVAAGVMALVYQAFEAEHERWPTWDEASSILMAGARFAGYDTLVMGAGVVDAADSVRIAGGHHGVYALPAEWQPGGYAGERHGGFAKIVHPGDTVEDTITLHNPSDADVEATIRGQHMRRVGHYFETLQADIRTEGPSSSAGPNHLIPIDRSAIPDGTDLMVVRGIVPMSEWDPNGDGTPDNSFTIQAYQHTDIDGDDRMWEDRNGSGTVDLSEFGDTDVTVTWGDASVTLGGIEGAITTPIPDTGIGAELGWFGRGCNVDDQIQDVEEKIALIERGLCPFTEKLLKAQAAGAIGALLFTDGRNKTAMGGDGTGITIPGAMIDRQPGLDIVELLEDGTVVSVTLAPSETPAKGLGVPQLNFEASELDEYEYMRFSQESSFRNNWHVSVHHPVERWADGIYIGVSHVGRVDTITVTEVSLRVDFYDYVDWEWLDVPEEPVVVPAGGTAEVPVSMTIPEDAAYGGHQGAVFVDYVRGEGDEPVGDADGYSGGYEIDSQRVVIPVNANVAARYEWDSVVTLGGESGMDMDAPYNLGAVRGTFNWNWRPESGDWRFFFVDAAEPPPSTYWVFRTFWDDETTGQADIDTRVLGPVDDRYSDPDDPANADEDMSDPDWFGPYGLQNFVRSAYQHVGGGRFAFGTSSGGYDDWLAAPAGRGGLHEVMLHNTVFSGTDFELPFETQVGALTINTARVSLFGEACGTLSLTSQLDLPGFTARGFGMSEPEEFEAEPIAQDNPDDRTTSSFKHDVNLPTEAGRFAVTLSGEDDDDLDLIVLYDANGDGEFVYPDERVAEGTSEIAHEEIVLPGFPAAGNYQVWVHGWSVTGADSAFDLTIDVVVGDDVTVVDPPESVNAGDSVDIEVCADTSEFGDTDGPLNGIVTFGPAGAPTLMQVPVQWYRNAPTIYLPLVLRNHEIGAVEDES